VIKKLTVLAAALAMAACAGTPAHIEHQAAPAPKTLATPDDARSIRLSRIVFGLTRGDRVGVSRSGWGCARQRQMIWAGDTDFVNDRDVTKTFTGELIKANYPVLGDPDALFPDDRLRPDLVVAGRITELKANFCRPNDEDDVRGETSMTIEWQVFDPETRRVLHKVSTRGDSKLDTAVLHGRQLLFNMALAQATQALLADQEFHAIVTNEKPSAAMMPVEAVFRLYSRPPRSEPVAHNMAEVQAATVTVLSGDGHGSGFFISADGFLLTNAHVVGDAKFVRVRLATGRVLAAEVFVVNRVRDVALVKVAETGLVSLPVAALEPRVGSEVYAIGAPREVSLATTVTRGIVSAYRERNGQRMLQGDVTIQKGNSGGPLTDSFGNVVGISTSGVMHGEFSVGLNFFIPIKDALKGAGIELGEVRNLAQMRALDRIVAVALQPGRPKPPPKPEPESAEAASPGPAPAPGPIVVADAPQQVASLPPAVTQGKRDGDYRARFTATTINGQSSVDLAISVEGEVIRGTGRTRGGLQCRANGEIAPDGTAWINVACSNAGSAYLSWQLAGRFAAEKDGAAYVGRLAYANLNGAPGEAVFRQ
jgi:serine protease Do